MKRFLMGLVSIFIFMLGCAASQPSMSYKPYLKVTPTPGPSVTPLPTKGPTATPTAIPPTSTSTETSISPTSTEVPSVTPTLSGPIEPYQDAPACPDVGANHDNSVFHTLWDSTRGCHYDHEHGDNPFIQAVADVFPGIYEFLGHVQVGHTNPSSVHENTDKHGGFKWHVQLQLPEPGVPFESGDIGLDAAVIQYHSFGDESIELEARTHSAVIFARQRVGDQTGLVYATTLQDYGQRIAPYQGAILPYPNQPVPSYPSPSGPYLSTACFGLPPCDKFSSRLDFLNKHGVGASNWTSKPTFPNHIGDFGTTVFQLLFRLSDAYKILDWNDQTYPLTFEWLCSNDGGATYDPIGCKYNNSTTQVAEVQGIIPVAWDNLDGFDTNPTIGRVTGSGFTMPDGTLTMSCVIPGMSCFPIKLENAFVGRWSAVLVYSDGKGTNVVSLRDGDIYFNGVSSGWIGMNN